MHTNTQKRDSVRAFSHKSPAGADSLPTNQLDALFKNAWAICYQKTLHSFINNSNLCTEWAAACLFGHLCIFLQTLAQLRGLCGLPLVCFCVCLLCGERGSARLPWEDAEIDFFFFHPIVIPDVEYPSEWAFPAKQLQLEPMKLRFGEGENENDLSVIKKKATLASRNAWKASCVRALRSALS